VVRKRLKDLGKLGAIIKVQEGRRAFRDIQEIKSAGHRDWDGTDKGGVRNDSQVSGLGNWVMTMAFAEMT
jgi:hypothetical protein